MFAIERVQHHGQVLLSSLVRKSMPISSSFEKGHGHEDHNGGESRLHKGQKDSH